MVITVHDRIGGKAAATTAQFEFDSPRLGGKLLCFFYRRDHNKFRIIFFVDRSGYFYTFSPPNFSNNGFAGL